MSKYRVQYKNASNYYILHDIWIVTQIDKIFIQPIFFFSGRISLFRFSDRCRVAQSNGVQMDITSNQYGDAAQYWVALVTL